MSKRCEEDPPPEYTEKFLVVGIITSEAFQKCRFIVNKLYNCFPDLYEVPDIRPMLNVEFTEYLIKIQRKYGNGIWSLQKAVVVFLNEKYLGDDEALMKHLSKKYRFSFSQDWYELGKCHLTEYLGNIMRKFRQLAYVTVSINSRVIGAMLFELYNDLVPLACENFMLRCKLQIGGYVGAPIHRIVKNGWIQCGGFNLQETKMPCENYVVPHNRRGVLSMCNSRRHRDNTTQFFITLVPASWMDHNYVAFGQLIQGAEILKRIEEVPTDYQQAPKDSIEICKAGELVFNPPPDFISEEEFDKFQHIEPTTLLDSLIGPPMGTSDSTFSMSKFLMGLYGLKTDIQNYLPVSPPQYVLQEEDYNLRQ
ncbi:hypothetical protein NQ318_014019 [Aromia moschata]|uniref:PPIase cyclophilin-type domain-containing protein n=1 Tax=Aromia moschata TaxID=1265417 RepID=A0AAV8Z0T7_9CUCU|nr:hypothetical protein NQ318_014019 [Aromia moschata]